MGQLNFTTRTVWTGDNLDILRGINSESIDLIYLDPPFNSNKTYSAPIGSKAAGAAFRNLTVDHIVPQSKGGSDHLDNLQLLCGACNSKKGGRTMEALIADLLTAQIRPETPQRRTRR